MEEEREEIHRGQIEPDTVSAAIPMCREARRLTPNAAVVLVFALVSSRSVKLCVSRT